MPASAMNGFPFVRRTYDIGEIVMRLVLKRVANGKWRMLGDGQSVGRGKLRSNVATRIAKQPGDGIRATEEVVLPAGYRTVA